MKMNQPKFQILNDMHFAHQILLIDMNSTFSENFYTQEPKKLYRNALQYSKTIGTKFDDSPLPYSPIKEAEVRNNAQTQIDELKYIIDRTKYQNDLYRRIQSADLASRMTIKQKLLSRDQKVSANKEKLREKSIKRFQAYNRKLNDTKKKLQTNERNLRLQNQDQAEKLRKQLISFYEKEKDRKKQAEIKQVSVRSNHDEALQRISRIHEKSKQFSLLTQKENEERMQKNNSKSRNLLSRSQAKSLDNRRKLTAYQINCEILEQKEKDFIGTYFKDLDTSEKCLIYKKKQALKTKDRISKFLKEKRQKHRGLKRRVEQQKHQISPRCQSLMQKTERSKFNKTISTFKSSSQNWYSEVQKNKGLIYNNDECQKDKIMNLHMDMRLKNTNISKVNENMNAIKLKAQKVTKHYL